MKMSDFENPTWRAAAILKIVISPCLSRESSEFHEIWYADANFYQGDGNVTKIQKFPNSRCRTDAIFKIIFLAITRLHIVRLRRNFEIGGIIARIWIRIHMLMKMSNFENPTWRTVAILKMVISPYLSREWSEFDKIWYADANFDKGGGKWQKNQKFANSNGGWTPP